MYIKNLIIENFRGIKDGNVNFKPGMNMLIGASNSGKSTILKAIDFVLYPNHSWWWRDILDTFDFFMEDTNNPIVIDMMLGCGRRDCTGTGGNCSRFEVIAGDDVSEICKLRECLVYINKVDGQVVKADNIVEGIDVEGCLHVKMTATYIKEGYAEVIHKVLDEDGNDKCDFTRAMKEWIGIVSLEASRNPDSECRLQYNSMLSRCVGEVGEWQKDFVDTFRSDLKKKIEQFSAKEAKILLDNLRNAMKPVKPVMNGEPAMSIAGAAKRDLLRQVELCIIRDELELPISRHGRGTQNMMSLLLATLAQATPKELRPPTSIILIEEPEQNLEPGMQRSIVSFMQNSFLCNEENRQCILTTHSPFVLTSSLDLMRVYHVTCEAKGKMACRDLGEIQQLSFPAIRNRVCFENELFECLFGSLIVIWEGKCEAGLYQAIMRMQQNYPAELLSGVVAGGASNLLDMAKWFRDGGYTPIVVCDGDAESKKAMSDLKNGNFAFIALPNGKNLEDCVADHIATVQSKTAVIMLLNVMGAAGTFDKGGKDAENIKNWSALDAVFTQENKSSLDTNLIISKMLDAGLPNRDIVIAILRNHKERYKYRILGEELSKSGNLGVFKQVIDKLKDIWINKNQVGRFQLQNDGTLTAYSEPQV